MPQVAKQCKTITGVTLQKFVDHMSEQQAKETLKVMIAGAEMDHGRLVMDFESIDGILRHMVS